MHSKRRAARSSTGPRLRPPPFGSPTRRPQANGQASSHTRSWLARRPPGINQVQSIAFRPRTGQETGAFMSCGRTRTEFSPPSWWESIQISASSSARIRCSTVRPGSPSPSSSTTQPSRRSLRGDGMSGSATAESTRTARSSAMEHGVYDDLRPSGLEEHGVRESSQKCPPRRAVDKLVSFGMASDRREAGIEGLKKTAGETKALCVVPRVGFINIKLRLRSETKAPYLRRSSLARTCSQDFAAEGLRA